MKKIALIFVTIVLLIISSCSIQNMAVDMIADALTGDGNSEVFMGDDDPQLVADSLPFAIKLYESLLQMNPEHRGLNITTGSLYIMYANAFLQSPASMLGPESYDKQFNDLRRAKKLYLRGRDMLSSFAETRYPGLNSAINSGENLEEILDEIEEDDVDLLYWIGAGWFGAISIDSFDMELAFRIPAVVALLERAYELDPDFNNGSLDELFIQVYAAIPDSMGGSRDKAIASFERAILVQKGSSAGPYLSLAKAVAIPTQNIEMFNNLIEKALSINPDDYPETRLLNTLAQRQARWYLEHVEDFFIL